MDEAILRQHLQQAEQHAALGAEHIERQREIIGELRRAGADLTEALKLLENLENMQKIHIADRARLRRELGLGE